MERFPGAPLPPVPYEEFQSNYRSIFPDAASDLPGSPSAFYRPVDAPRITPPPPSSLFATSESESLANFLHDFEDNSDFLFQPALPAGIPDFGLMAGQEAGPFASPPAPPASLPPLPMEFDPALHSIDVQSLEPAESEPPSPKRYKMMETVPPVATVQQVDGMETDQPDTASDTDTRRSRQASRNTTATSPTASASSHTSLDARNAKQRALLTEEEKRSNHIQSEQKRRNAIRDGFAELVTILQTGERYSGLSIGHDGDDGSGRKARGRGRGRKGDHSAAASKSVVLAQAVKYVRWLQNGNEALEQEVARLESIAGVA